MGPIKLVANENRHNILQINKHSEPCENADHVFRLTLFLHYKLDTSMLCFLNLVCMLGYHLHPYIYPDSKQSVPHPLSLPVAAAKKNSSLSSAPVF